jgi:hypothetical protein
MVFEVLDFLYELVELCYRFSKICKVSKKISGLLINKNNFDPRKNKMCINNMLFRFFGKI